MESAITWESERRPSETIQPNTVNNIILEHVFDFVVSPLAFLVYFWFSIIAHDIEGDYDSFPEHKAKNPGESM